MERGLKVLSFSKPKSVSKKMLFALTVILLSTTAFGGESFASSKNEIFDNPFVSVGLDKTSGALTGFLMGLRTAPGRTDACKLFFNGVVHDSADTMISIRDAAVANGSIKASSATQGKLVFSGNEGKLIANKSALPGDCAWVLSFIGEPAVTVRGEIFSIAFEPGEAGSWKSVRVVSAKRAYFYDEPNQNSKTKGFMVAEDLMYIYDEKPGWYFVKFKGRKNKTVGWIKSTDALQ
jgi:hypothetical protein